ncbi:MAG: hypothetical protein Q9199_003953 [Rusavskia elegans]
MYTKIKALSEEGLKLDLPATEEWIMTSFRDIIGIMLLSSQTDFFSSGVDSLKAIQMRRLIQKTSDLQGVTLSPNIVYEKAKARDLALYLFALRRGEEIQQEDDSILAQQLIKKYTVFEKYKHLNGLDCGVNGDVVKRWGNAAVRPPFSSPSLCSFPMQSNLLTTKIQFLTGTTGSIGAHTLSQLLSNPTITKIYYPIRGSNPLQRVFASLSTRHLSVPEKHQHKIFAFESDLSQPDFSLDPSTFALLKRECALIIHIAWPVNFNLPLKSFEPYIRGLHNLLSLSTGVKRPQPAQLFLASSISVALKSPAYSVVPKSLQVHWTYVSAAGYTGSKFLGERIVLRAVEEAGARAYILRTRQLVGATEVGL